MNRVQDQQQLVRRLRDFVDALRDIGLATDVDKPVEDAIRALCQSCSVSPTTGAPQDLVWQQALVPTLHSLVACMEQIDALEAEKKAEEQHKHGPVRPEAPAGLLSLRDYSVLQATIEVLFCWCVHPRIDTGILPSIEKRRPTKTLAIYRNVLQWGTAQLWDESDREVALLEITKTMYRVLFLDQFRPILLPKYTVELLALLVYGKSSSEFSDETRQEYDRILQDILQTLPLRLSMGSLRAALGQADRQSTHDTVIRFRQECSSLLTQLLLKDGGIYTTMEMLLGAVDEGNTQARMQVATLICQCPKDMEDAVYVRSLCRQLQEILQSSTQSSKVIGETAALVADQLAGKFPQVFMTNFIVPVFHHLFMYEDTRRSVRVDASEDEISTCIAMTERLMCGPMPSKALLQLLTHVMRPLAHMYGLAVQSKSFQRSRLESILTTYMRQCPGAEVVIQLSVLPVVPSLPDALAACGGYERQQEEEWKPVREYCAGPSGGIAMRSIESELSAKEILQNTSTALSTLLCSDAFEESSVVGELFSSLLLTYMKLKNPDEDETNSPSTSSDTTIAYPRQFYANAIVPTSADGVEMTLRLLLSIIEALGPSVMQSAETILHCISTVLSAYIAPKQKLVDSAHDQQSSPETEDEDENDEMLTICLGVVMTILEVGSTNRSESEEQALKQMLSPLEQLSQDSRPEVADLASDCRAKILSRGAPSEEKRRSSSQSFEIVLAMALQDLQSSMVPMRARGVVTLTKLVRSSTAERQKPEWQSRVQQLLAIFLQQLEDQESYVFLAAVNGLSSLADAHPDVAIPMLVAALEDKTASVEKRIKLSEALLFSARRCGDTLPKYASKFVHAYLSCVQPPKTKRSVSAAPKLIEEVDTEKSKDEDQVDSTTSEALEDATLRASCLSNLAEMCALLQWAVHPFALDVVTCALGVLQVEANTTDKSTVAVRRGAAFLIFYLLQLLGYKVLELVPEQLQPLYHTLKVVERQDKDEVVQYHAKRALQALDELMRAELFPTREAEDDAFGVSSLRIL